ncbi:MAG: hypothetical protein LBV36_02045 [Chromatiales bacterium]|jgi:hypothetical protein|nr:hypothetical protein [Chromatiales bacterium]
MLAALLAGCAGSRVDSAHPLLTHDAKAARVYFIRPFTDRPMGFADNAIAVEVDRVSLLKLVKGEYTMSYINPGAVFFTVHSDTSWGPEFLPKKMTRSKRFQFAPGETYFVVFRPIDGEFRGVNFDMASVSLEDARELSRHLRVAGSAARSEPIDEL